MIDETIKKYLKAQKAALLATVPTVQSGIFQEALNREGYDFYIKIVGKSMSIK